MWLELPIGFLESSPKYEEVIKDYQKSKEILYHERYRTNQINRKKQFRRHRLSRERKILSKNLSFQRTEKELPKLKI